MEWIELLKMLSEQQSDKVTQEQINALQEALRQAEREQAITGLVFIGLLVLLMALICINHYIHGQRFKKIEAKITRLDSISLEKSDVRD